MIDYITGETVMTDQGDMADDAEYISSSPPSSTQTSTLTWIAWFTSLPGHDLFTEVAEDFIEDDFNLTGLQSQVPFWKEALEMVLDVEPEEDSLTVPDISIIESSAELLYGLVHQRYILTKVGLAAMVEKYEMSHFGACPRVFCHSTSVLPCGRSDAPGNDTVKLYCPNCGDIYGPPSSKYANVDGAFFGTTFPQLFFQTYPEFLSMPFAPVFEAKITGVGMYAGVYLDPPPPPNGDVEFLDAVNPPPDTIGGVVVSNPNPHGGLRTAAAKTYVPRIYGFKVSERARSGPRMQWLRLRPDTYDELDQVDWRGRWAGGEGGGGGGGMDDDRGIGPSGGGKSTLFDDDDDEKDEEESEEEEEDAPAAAAGGAAGEGGAADHAALPTTSWSSKFGKQKVSSASSSNTTRKPFRLPTSRSSPPQNSPFLFSPPSPTSNKHRFLPAAPDRPRRLRRSGAASATDTETELETPQEELKVSVIVRTGLAGKGKGKRKVGAGKGGAPALVKGWEGLVREEVDEEGQQGVVIV